MKTNYILEASRIYTASALSERPLPAKEVAKWITTLAKKLAKADRKLGH